MPLSRTEREAFLAEPHVGSLSVVERPDRAPLTLPIWYQYTPGGEVWIRTGPDSRKGKAIRAAGRFTMLAHRTEPTVRYVSAEGPVTSIRPSTPEEAEAMAARYLPAEKVAGFLRYEEEQLGDHVVFAMTPEHWLSSDLGAI